MKISNYSYDSAAQWDHFVEAHPSGSIYHSTAWINVLQRALNYPNKSLLLLDGSEVAGVLPLFEVRGLGGRRLISSPFRDRGGLLTNKEVNPAQLLDEAIRICRKGNYDFLQIKEEFPLQSEIVGRFDLKESSFWVTTIIDLTRGADGIWKKLANNAQGPVKKAEKCGVKVSCAELSRDMETFYDLFLRSRRNLGIPSFPKRFFMNIWCELCEKGRAKLFLAEKDSTAIAGIILLINKNTVIDGYAASLSEYRDLRPNDLLIWRSIEWAVSNGFLNFDFGADSPLQKSLLSFKKKWTGEHRTMYHYFLLNKARNLDEMDSSNAKYLLVRNLVKRLPLPVFRLVSDLCVARFG